MIKDTSTSAPCISIVRPAVNQANTTPGAIQSTRAVEENRMVLHTHKSLNGVLSLDVEPIVSLDALHSLAPEWKKLFDESGADTPFATFEWTDCWWKHLRQERGAVCDTLQIQAIRDQSGHLVAVAPLIQTDRPRTGPLRARLLQFVGADPNVTELRGMLSKPEYERDAYAALLRSLETTQWDWIQWSGLKGDGSASPVRQKLSVASEDISTSLLALPPTWGDFQAGLKRNIRESLRKCYNSLKRDNITFEFRIASSPSETAEAVDRFLVLHKARAKDEETSVNHLDVFASPAACRFLKDVCCRLAETGVTRIFQLVIDDKVVASRIGFQFQNSLYLYYSGYDPAWGKYSVMTTTVAEAIKYAIEQGLQTVNLSTGLDVAKTRWGPSHVTYGQGVQIAANRRSRLAYAAYQRIFGVRSCKILRTLTR